MAAGLRRLAILLLAATLAACAGRPEGPYYRDAPKPAAADDLATIYLLRSGNEYDRGGGSSFVVNGKTVFVSFEDTYSWIQVPPGAYSIAVATPPMYQEWNIVAPDLTPPPVTFDAEAGATYYVQHSRLYLPPRTETSIAIAGGIPVPVMETVVERIGERLDVVDEAEATSALLFTVYIPNSFVP